MSLRLGKPALWCLIIGFTFLLAGFFICQSEIRKVKGGQNTNLSEEIIFESATPRANLIIHENGCDLNPGNPQFYNEKTLKFDLNTKKTAEPHTNLFLSPPKGSSSFIHSSNFPSFFPYLFVSAHSISHSEPSSSHFEYSQILYFLFCSIELFLSFSHLLVHLGIKNSRYRFLTKQTIYFAADGSLTTINLLVFWDNYYYMKMFLVLAIILHAYYVIDLLFTNGKSKIFKWSSVDLAKDRFGLENIKENIETFIDDCCHFSGFLSAFFMLSSLLKVLAIGFGIAVLWILVLRAKFFFTKKHMMPCWLRNIIPEDSR